MITSTIGRPTRLGVYTVVQMVSHLPNLTSPGVNPESIDTIVQAIGGCAFSNPEAGVRAIRVRKYSSHIGAFDR
ncbi:hypothetical protein DL89DRAFT_265901 [Linderina pennispora]|uniref:Uncharacterized protein n=1 Tax=Linderina pennispora TaxID=61395 RepID=A0A1Y1WG37_9FUNG|nr:uncharacterized protein DL89DRAFT_265901 [Linderina pennispora]ORX72308.1 hypothetical protein DL89DRAFT_265901 [Linderina pennispora]